MINLAPKAKDAALEYAAALREACGKVDPVRVLKDTDAYPAIVKRIPMAEFLVGWFHGAADVLGVEPEALWLHVQTLGAAPQRQLASGAVKRTRSRAT